MSSAICPLVNADDSGSIVAWHRGGPITRERFLCDVTALAERVPSRAYAINLCENRYRFAVAFCAALLRGQVSLLPHNRTLEGVAEVAARYPSHFYLDDAGVRAEHPTGTAVPWAQARVDSGVASDGRVVGSESVPGIPADRAAAIVFTSGSTGSPRSHEKNWGSLAALASLQHGYLRQRHADLSGVLATVPPQHMFGLEASVMLPLRGGLPLHDGRPLFPDDVRRALAACGPAPLLVTTPIHLRALTRAEVHYPSCGLILSATSRLDRDLAAVAERRFDCEVHEIYGSTETGAMANRRTVVDKRWRLSPGIRVESDGSGTMRAVADFLPEPVPVMDRIEVDRDGCFELLERLDDAINIAGKHASLGDLNRRLLAIPGVRDGAIFRLKSGPGDPPRLGAMVVAPGLDTATICAAMRLSTDPVFVPRRIVFVDRLSRTDTGKLRRDTIEFNWRKHVVETASIEP